VVQEKSAHPIERVLLPGKTYQVRKILIGLEKSVGGKRLASGDNNYLNTDEALLM
jgi:hypothetical protein